MLLFLLVLFAQGVLSGILRRYKKVIRTEPDFIKHGSNINRTNRGNAYENKTAFKGTIHGYSIVDKKTYDIGIEHELKDYAIGLFRDKKVSLGKAAEISGISKRAMLDLLKERDIPLNISTRDIQKDFNAATE